MLEEEDAADEAVDECEAFFSVFAPPPFSVVPSSREPDRVTDDDGLRFIRDRMGRDGGEKEGDEDRGVERKERGR